MSIYSELNYYTRQFHQIIALKENKLIFIPLSFPFQKATYFVRRWRIRFCLALKQNPWPSFSKDDSRFYNAVVGLVHQQPNRWV